MFGFFRKQRTSPPEGKSIYIDGNLYMRFGGGVGVVRRGQNRMIECDSDHVAPNGTPIKQIAYALAIVEGLIMLGDPVPPSCYQNQRRQIGLN